MAVVEYRPVGAVRRSLARFPVSRADRLFLLVRLQDRPAVAQAILERGVGSVGWDRAQIMDAITSMIGALLQGKGVLFVMGNLQLAILREAVEANPYFATMDDGDPRLCGAAIRQADALAFRLASLSGRPVSLPPLGEGRSRGAPALHPHHTQQRAQQ